MAEITAKSVNELRAKTGLPMMKCKQLLTANGGDPDKAFEAARKEGLKDSIRERAASEGRVAVGTGADRKVAPPSRSSATPTSPPRARPSSASPTPPCRSC